MLQPLLLGGLLLIALGGHRVGAQPGSVPTGEEPHAEDYMRTTYVGAVAIRSISSTMNTFMTKPIDAIRYSLPAHSLGTLQSTDDIRQWLYTQVIAVNHMVDNSFTMFYAGLEDGRFIGYYDPLRYTFRPADEALADQPSTQELCHSPDRSHAEHSVACAAVVLDGSAATCTEGVPRPTCDLLEATDGSAACPAGCMFTPADGNTPASCTGDEGGSRCVYTEAGSPFDRYAPFTLAMGSTAEAVDIPDDSYRCNLTSGDGDYSTDTPGSCASIQERATCDYVPGVYSVAEASCTSTLT
eukprot:COSAG02_NODE_18244_length_951_cov_1.870892_1_plen_297_part_01